MKRNYLLVAACLFVVAASTARGDEAVSLFDGKSLDGWDGNPDFWSVKDEVITGTTTAEKPTNGNTFLIWKKGELKDFELSLKFRIEGGNSGIQFRSKDKGNWVVNGYQADFDAGNGWTGSFYEEGGRGILAKRGQKVEITENGERKESEGATPEKEIVDSVKKDGGWNDYVITAKGNQITFKVNGLTTVELTDNQASNAAESGILALQLHAGPPMVVQFKDIMFKELK
jgi:hypothetical protein